MIKCIIILVKLTELKKKNSIRSVQLFITKTTFYNIILYLQHTLYGNIMNAFKRGLFDCFHQIMKSLKFDYLKNIILFIYFLWRFFFILILYPQIIGPRTMSWEQSIDQRFFIVIIVSKSSVNDRWIVYHLLKEIKRTKYIDRSPSK